MKRFQTSWWVLAVLVAAVLTGCAQGRAFHGGGCADGSCHASR